MRNGSASKRDRSALKVRRIVQSLGGSRIGVFMIGRFVSPLQRWLYRVSGGRISLTGRVSVLLLTTIGRKTGLARTVPLFFLRDGDRFVVCNVTPPSERTNPWTLNVRANPRVVVQVKDDSIECLAREATAAETNRLWPELTRIWPAYERFFERGGTRSIFLLQPAGGPR